MVFSSLTFLVFFLPIVLLCYFAGKNRQYRNAVLLLFSLLFYAWGEPKWIFVMLLTVSVNYFSGILIAKAKTKTGKLFGMLFGVLLGLGFLIYFKYCGFLLENLSFLFGKDIAFSAPTLPIGISFYTFQVLTYTIDVYKGKVPVQKSFWKLLLYVSFFPQLIAGPIVNYKDIEPQLDARSIQVRDFYEGFLRFLCGFCKKIILANLCGEVVDGLVQSGSGIPGSTAGAWLLSIAFSFQLYFDFSAYSDMAIGLGRMFGFHFAENFRHPYASKSAGEFFRRWHISLGAFFREYVYIPLGGNRVSVIKCIRNLMVVWILTGIWHGASWNFVIWGLYYGILLVLERYVLAGIKKKLPDFVNILLTLFVAVIGWTIFYYTDMSMLTNHLLAMFGGATPIDGAAIYYVKRYLGILLISAVCCVPFNELLLNFSVKHPKAVRVYSYAKPVLITILFIVSVAMLVSQSYNPFLYFRF